MPPSPEVNTAAALLAFRSSGAPATRPSNADKRQVHIENDNKDLGVDTSKPKETHPGNPESAGNNATPSVPPAAQNVSVASQLLAQAAARAQQQQQSLNLGMLVGESGGAQLAPTTMNFLATSNLGLNPTAPQPPHSLPRSLSMSNILSPLLLTQAALSATAPSAPAAATPTPSTGETQPPIKDSVQDSIRPEEVEKALRSKPQRGRKRNNLNSDERQELARTRNREHAKSTRLRKKQRLEELMEVERRYLLVLQRHRLESARANAVRRFFQERQARHLASSLSAKGGRQSARDDDDDDDDKESHSSSAIIDSLMTYSCIVNASTCLEGDSELMKELDEQLVGQVTQLLGLDTTTTASALEIRLTDLALCTDSDSATVQVGFRVQETHLLVKLMLAKLTFARESDEILSLQETKLEHVVVSSSDLKLQSQLSQHPSVVSLEEKTRQYQNNKIIKRSDPSDEPNHDGLFIDAEGP